MEKISIIVPVYNVEPYIHKCVDSILAQTYSNIEVILVDDGSPDNCGIICDEYAEKDDRVVVIHKENGGLSDARNAGIDKATGEYIGFVDSDDYIVPDMYEKLYKSLKENNAEISICSFTYVGGKEYLNNTSPIKDEIISGKDVLFNKMMSSSPWFWIVTVTKLYKKNIFDNIRFPYRKLHEDEFTIHKIMLCANRISCISDKLYYYVQHSHSITNSKININRMDIAEAKLSRAEYYIKEHCPNIFICDNLITGINRTVIMYSKCRGQDGARTKYKNLVKMFRKNVSFRIFSGVPVIKVARICISYISPYYTEKTIEFFRK